jgi:thioredoxin 1
MNKVISKDNFKQWVVNSNRLALVQFKTEWSGACQIAAMIFEELAGSYQEMVNFFTVDVERDNELDNEYGIMELPTILFFKDGSVIDHITGMVPKKDLVEKINNALIEITTQS